MFISHTPVSPWRGEKTTQTVRQPLSPCVAGLGWRVFVEVSFARYGERGSVDVLVWDPTTRTVVMASLTVLALDFVLTALMFKL